MKIQKINIAILLLIVGFVFSSCKEEKIIETPSPIQEGGVQAYIYDNTPRSYAVTPDLPQSFEVTFGRYNEAEAASVDLQVVDADNKFNVPALTFAPGEKTKKLTITYDLAIGDEAALTLFIPENQAYIYGNDSINFVVKRDYTWLDAGSVEFISDWAGATKDIKIEKAKEGTGLYRLLDVYHVLEPDYAPEPGYHIQITLDESYNAVSLPIRFTPIGEAATTGGEWFLYWNPAQYGKFYNTGNDYTIEGAWASTDAAGAATLRSLAKERFIWNEGYPGAQ